MKIVIDNSIRAAAPALALGVVTASVRVSDSAPSLWEDIARATAEVRSALSVDQIPALPTVAAQRELYRQLGADPNRYRGSAEALMRRLTQQKDLYRVNTVVDVNNLVSIITRHPVGSYDLDRLSGPVTFRPGVAGESYTGIGKGEVRLAGLPVFADGLGPFGSPTSDSMRAMIRPDTTRIATVVIACGGDDQLGRQLERLAELLRRYASAEDIGAEISST